MQLFDERGLVRGGLDAGVMTEEMVLQALPQFLELVAQGLQGGREGRRPAP